MTSKKPLPDFIVAHLRHYAEDPVAAHLWDASFVGGSTRQPIMLLTTIGRRSGEPHTLPLIYANDGERYIIVASNGGAAEDPGWFRNFQAAGLQAKAQVADKKFRVAGRIVQGEERAAMWEKLCAAYAPMDSYKTRTDREIPVIVLDVVNE